MNILKYSALSTAVATLLLPFGLSRSDAESRGVRIIDGAPPAAAVVPELPPMRPPSVSPPQPSANPTPPPVAADPQQNAVAVPAVPLAGSDQPRPDFSTLNGVKTTNPAGLTIEILPGQEIVVGAKITFRITAKKSGFLILVDVDPTGKLTQIYPNPRSLMASGGSRQNANYIRAANPIQIPNPSDPYAGFEFVAAPPLGMAVVIAFLSDRPVQLIDLPDLPVSLIGQPASLSHVVKLAGELRIPKGDGPGLLQEAHWSFAAKYYSIR